MGFSPYCLYMATKFTDFVREMEAEARAEGRESVEELETFRAHFRLGRELAEARRSRKLTQSKVAQLADIDQSEISDLERGVANPTFDTLSAIAHAVGMEVGFRPAARRRRA